MVNSLLETMKNWVLKIDFLFPKISGKGNYSKGDFFNVNLFQFCTIK
jgi:hypothetical protein